MININNLQSFKKNKYSQNGEDGIILEALNRLKKEVDLDEWCVEFGAWNGIHLSNTYNLIKNYNYKALLIEGDSNRYKELCLNIPNKSVHKLCKFVTLDGNSTLDKILNSKSIPINFDFLSIDIDGCDYYIFESLKVYRPKIICIEYNPTIPNEVDYVQKRDFSVKQGASALAIINLAEAKGYKLLAVTDCNLIFAKTEYKQIIIGNEENNLNQLRDDSDLKTFIFSGYDGTILSNKAEIKANWHNYSMPINKLQILPKYLRKYSGDYNKIEKFIFAIYILTFSIKTFINLIKIKLKK